MEKLDGHSAAAAFIEEHYRDCVAALLCGSVARGEARPHSDLDLLIITGDDEPFGRRTYQAHGWLIEIFAGSFGHFQEKLQPHARRRNPSFAAMLAGAVILRDRDDRARSLIGRAEALLVAGPAPLSADELEQFRYELSDWLDDLADCTSSTEALFVVPDLIAKAAELLLLLRGRWSGARRWLYRALAGLDDDLARQLLSAAERFYRSGDRDDLVTAVDAILALVGGRLYEGFIRS